MLHVIVHNSVSADGRIDGFEVDIGVHYEIASRFDAEVHLAGSATILAAGLATDEAAEGADAAGAPASMHDDPHDSRALLVVVDSRGEVRCWDALREAPHWRDRMVALCSHATPASYLEHLRAHRVDHVIAGDERVDLRAALAEVERRYHARRVLVDSGGVLNGVLLRAGLAHEVSLLVHPQLVDGDHPSMFRPPGADGTVALRLTALEQCTGGIAWLRYDVGTADTS